MSNRTETKSRVLEFLIKHENANISGEKIAKELKISRTSIWQIINKLKLNGHQIESNGNKGYKYRQSDILSVEAIKFHLPLDLKDLNIKCYDSINSTNKAAKIEIINGAKEGTIIISNVQLEGYGRYGRGFFCSESGGIYLSIILKPKTINENISLITIKTAVAAKRAIDKLSHRNIQIKWVNDLYLNNKKVSGILTEGIIDYESNTVNSIVVGIGINFSIENFPEELKDIAGSIFDAKSTDVTRNMLIAEFLKEFFLIYKKNGDKDLKDILLEYKNASFLLGKEIEFLKDDIKLSGKAIDIDSKGELVVELPSKEVISLFSGEVSVKIKK